MNAPNITLLIQGIHFFLAYLVITRIFLRPATTLVLAKDFKLHQEQELLVMQEARLFTAQEEQRRRWHELRAALHAASPKIAMLQEFPQIPVIVERKLPAEEVDRLVKEVEDALVKQLIH